MKNKSASQHSFAVVPNVSRPRSIFNRSHSYKTCFDSDYLIPFYYQNVLPGDSVKCKHSILIRLLSNLTKPIMDNLHFDWFYFFVPYRLIWANFKKFMGEQDTPTDSISFNVPQCTGPGSGAGGIAIGSLHDYFGLPTGTGVGASGITFNNLYPRAYMKIWFDHFKDQNLQNYMPFDVDDGPDTYTDYVLLKRGKRHDYFTSALPFLQKGVAATVPIGTLAPVKGLGVSNQVYGSTPTGLYETGTAGTTSFPYAKKVDPASANTDLFLEGSAATGGYPLIYADLSNASLATINQLRQSISLQQFLENDARGGTRYIEIVRQRFGVVSPDARQQRSEILSLGTSPIKISVVAKTADIAPMGGSAENNAAQLAGFGTGASVGDGFTKSFTEHGCIIGLCSVRADLSYQYGLDREWSYRTRYDFYNPEFANLGEQSILNKEIYASCPDGTGAAQKDGVFGYQERYAEYRYSNNKITSILRSNAAGGSLDIWHLAESFSGLPTLGSTFIESNTPLDRVIQVPTQPHWIIDVEFDEKWARVMPMFSVPGLKRL